MNQRSLEEIFSDFIFSVYGKRPEQMPPNQARDLKFTFYAGCVAVNDTYLDAADHTDQSAFQKLDKLQNEINTFVKNSFPDSLKN
jgi:hypothetical protein